MNPGSSGYAPRPERRTTGEGSIISAPRDVAVRALNLAPGLKARLKRGRVRAGQFTWSDVAGMPLPPPATGTPVLIATSGGGQLEMTQVEGVLAAALRRRGVEVHVLLCDEVLPACHLCTFQGFGGARRLVRDGPQKLNCPSCFEPGAAMYAELGVEVLAYGDFLDADDHRWARELASSVPFEHIAGLSHGSVAVGEHAMAGALRFFAAATLDREDRGEEVVRRYLEAAYLTARAVEHLLDRHSYRAAVFHHGIYVPQGIIGDVARARRLPVVNWNIAYRSRRFVFSHGDTYHKTMMDEPTGHWECLALSDEQDARLQRYLDSRDDGADDWVSFNRAPAPASGAGTGAVIGLDPSKPVIGLLTNVMWDAQLHYPANVFPDMLTWCLETIRYFGGRPDLQLLIRVHPAELTGLYRSRQFLVDEIDRAFPRLPPNVFVVGPENRASTYELMRGCNSALIYGTKTGVELAAVGLPVIVAGEAWIRNKGLTFDARDRQDYIRLLGELPRSDRLDAATVTRARRYAYHFFFRRMIPLEFMTPAGSTALYRSEVTDLAQLDRGRSAGLDVICDGILHGTPFVYEADG